MKPCRRALFAGIATTALFALAFAYYLQHVGGLLPCPYCVLQRYVFMAIVLASAIAWIDVRRARWHGTVVGLVAAFGAGLALYQWQNAPSMTSCRVDPVGELVNGLPMAQWWPDYLLAEGSCADRAAVLAGVPIPLASAMVFATLLAAAAWVAMRRS